MAKSKIELEYDLKSPSLSALWTSVATPLGLAEWFADGVTVNDNTEYTFSWDKNDETAVLLENKSQSHIRFQWQEDEGTEAFFEIRILINNLTSNVMLHITDFAEKGEEEILRLLWNKQVENLRRKNGL